jgi:replicative DNA helicase
VVVVDYLQRMDHGRAERRDVAIGNTAQGLKNLARTLDVVVIALCQLGRGVDSRRNPKASTWKEAVAIPYSSDLRESGQIEQEADCIIYPVRPTDDLAERDDVTGHEALVVVAKNRHGPTAILDAMWDGPRFAYRDLPGAGLELLS